MAQHASRMQTSFLGGEWSPLFQGRADHPNYKYAMNVCRNAFPVEEGSWVRRSGSRMMAPTYKGLHGRLYQFALTTTAPYNLEFTDDGTHGYLRMFNGLWPVATEEVGQVASVTTANPAVVNLNSPVPWVAGDEVGFVFTDSSIANYCAPMRQRSFIIGTVTTVGTPTAWDSTYTYGSGSRVSYGGLAYISLIYNNLNHQPDISPLDWQLISATDAISFTLTDGLTGANVDGSTLNASSVSGVFVLRAVRKTTPYINGSWENTRVVQTMDNTGSPYGVLLNPAYAPQVLNVVPYPGQPQAAAVDLAAAVLLDGPYLDPITGSIASISGTTGIVSMSVAFQAYNAATSYKLDEYVTDGANSYKSLQGGNVGHTPASSPTYWQAVPAGLAVTGNPNASLIGFQSTDVGRQVRLYSTPTPWVSGTYTTGNRVYWQYLCYECQAAGTTTQPDMDAIGWKVVPSGTFWTWGIITQVVSAVQANVEIQGLPLGYSGVDVATWRLGVYSETSGYPSCGIFAQGRLWLGGAQPNRFDSSMSNGILQDNRIVMSPTGPGAHEVTAQQVDTGQVIDSNGISYTLEDDLVNPIYWFQTNKGGLVAGTLGGEWTIDSTNGADPITPTNIQCNKVSKYGCADIEPRRTGLALVFVQKFKHRVMEFLADVFTGRFMAPHLTEAAKHLTQETVQEIAYQEELVPIVWSRTGLCASTNGALVGCTYRRISAWTTEAPKFAGWHRHDLGTSRTVESIAVGPSQDGLIDSLAIVTSDPLLESSNAGATALPATVPVRWNEMFMKMFDQADTIDNAWFVDGGLVPDSMYADTVAGQAGYRFTGLWYLQGMTVDVFAGGLDLGQYVIDSSGTVFVPFGSGVAPTGIVDFTTVGAGHYAFTAAFVDSYLAAKKNLLYPVPSTNGATTATVVSYVAGSNPNASSSVQSFLPTSGQTLRSDNYVIDWGQGNLIFPSLLSTTYSFTGFNLASGAQNAYYTTTDSWTTVPAGSDQNGNFYHPDSGGMSYVSLKKYAEVAGTVTTIVSATGGAGNPGPPAYPGVPVNCRFCDVLKANNDWILTIGNSGPIIYSATGTFVAGNNSTDPAYMGVNQTAWGMTGSGAYSASQPGAPLKQGNVAVDYFVSRATDFAFFAVGVMDGVPTNASEGLNSGKKGKGKSKKGAGIIHTPSVDDPLTIYWNLGTVSPGQVDPYWAAQTFGGGGGCQVDRHNNSILFTANVHWGTTTNFDTTYATLYAADLAALPTYDAATTYALDTVVTNGTGAYASLVAGNVGNLLTDTLSWKALSLITDTMTIIHDNTDLTASPFYATKPGVKNIYMSSGNPKDNITLTTTQWIRMTDWYLCNVLTGPASLTGNDPFGLNWVVPLGGYNVFLSPHGRIEHGVYCGAWSTWYTGEAQWPFFIVDCVTGKWGQFEQPGLDKRYQNSVGAWDDISRSMILGVTYDSTATGAPTALNSTISGSGWFRYYVGSNVADSLWPTSTDYTTGGYYNPLNKGHVPVSQISGYNFTYTETALNAGNGTSGGAFQCGVSGGFPAIVGQAFDSQGQVLRPITPQDTIDNEGMAFVSKRRSHAFVASLYNTMGISYGTSFSNMTPMVLKDGPDGNTGNQIMTSSLFSGMVKYQLKDEYSYDSMIAWEVKRPYPSTVVAVGAKLENHDA